MDELSRVFLTLGVGYAGALLFVRLRVPAGQLLGPMIVVGLLHAFGAPLVQLGPGFRYAAQIVVGATLASTLTPAVVAQILRLVGPAAFGVALLIVLAILGGWGLHLATGLEPASALFAGSPGGAVEMALAAGDLGGDVELVAALHIFRQFTVILLVPLLLRWAFRKRRRRE